MCLNATVQVRRSRVADPATMFLLEEGIIVKKYAELTAKDMSDSGQALVLICLILSLFTGSGFWIWAALAALVVNMANSSYYKGFAFFWLNFSHVLGKAVSFVVMTLEFFLLVLPIGLVRRALGRDALALRKWRQNRDSVFVTRDHQYTADDLRHPY